MTKLRRKTSSLYLSSFASENKQTMPINKDALNRIRIIDGMLANPLGSYTTEDILRRVNGACGSEQRTVSLRMIQKDIKAIDEQFGKKIIRVPGYGGRRAVRYEDQSQPIFTQKLSDDEAAILHEALKTLGSMEGLENLQWLETLRKRLNEKIDDQEFPLISFSCNENLRMQPNMMGRLYLAISRRVAINIKYQRFGAEPSEFIISPYQLKQYNDRWYLIGTPMGDDTFKYRRDFYINLPLDRINSISAVEGVEYVDCDDSFEERFDDIIGVTFYEDVPVEEILIAVKRNHAGYIETKPLHGSQIKLVPELQAEKHLKYPTLSEYDFYNLSLRPNREFYSLLYQFGLDILVISPESIRLKAANEFNDIPSTITSARQEAIILFLIIVVIPPIEIIR